MRMLVVLACLIVQVALAQAPAPPPARIESMAWLAGYWEGEGLGGTMEDIWMPPRDGVILGAFRLTKPDGKGFGAWASGAKARTSSWWTSRCG